MTCVYAATSPVGFIVFLIVIGVFNAIRKMGAADKTTPQATSTHRASPQNDLELFLKSLGAQEEPPPAVPPLSPPALPSQPPAQPRAPQRHPPPLRWQDTAIVRSVTSRFAGKQRPAVPDKPVAVSSRQRMKDRAEAEAKIPPVELHGGGITSRGGDSHFFSMPALPAMTTMPQMSIVDLHHDLSYTARVDGQVDPAHAADVFVMPDLNDPQTLRGTILAREILSAAVALRQPLFFLAGPIS